MCGKTSETEKDQVDERRGRKMIEEMEVEVGRGSSRWKWRLEEDQVDESGGWKRIK